MRQMTPRIATALMNNALLRDDERMVSALLAPRHTNAMLFRDDIACAVLVHLSAKPPPFWDVFDVLEFIERAPPGSRSLGKVRRFFLDRSDWNVDVLRSWLDNVRAGGVTRRAVQKWLDDRSCEQGTFSSRRQT